MFETKIRYWRKSLHYKHEFLPEDVLPKYEIYKDGSMKFFIKVPHQFLFFKWDNIVTVMDKDIELIKYSIPIEVKCYAKG